ncbi:MAG: class I SAM-dependent methyltransferase [Candidatus Margulisbacteria bacterium]|jgi:SAM-dependent methyltransferase|nr:class I SAM-dependent methyltransferase [Candidatus Margulisiibacteriota bacterium]
MELSLIRTTIKVFKSILLSVINNPAWNVRIQQRLRPLKKHKIILAELLREIPRARVLDYGCGEGIFADCFAPDKYLGYDPEPKRIDYAKKQFPEYSFTAQKPNLNDFDLLFFNNVWHHLTEAQIKNLLRGLTAGKIALLELKPPSEQRGVFFKLILWLEAKTHYSRPRKASFYNELLKRHGFTLQQNRDLERFFLQLYCLRKV